MNFYVDPQMTLLPQRPRMASYSALRGRGHRAAAGGGKAPGWPVVSFMSAPVIVLGYPSGRLAPCGSTRGSVCLRGGVCAAGRIGLSDTFLHDRMSAKFGDHYSGRPCDRDADSRNGMTADWSEGALNLESPLTSSKMRGTFRRYRSCAGRLARRTARDMKQGEPMWTGMADSGMQWMHCCTFEGYGEESRPQCSPSRGARCGKMLLA